ncbi:hypothetical protein [Desulfuromonas acetoxidans]|uniref:Uncharacterized conserved coiled coil protein n=1 Tax=Desulfuromonas acetoxidans (strain DSM 684 / 11070) TaxID=281689 RepID=Q1K3D9_DESA6|nr:hypothetical protein [Desulfuromonas acetoxidans]EAT17035.1 uncharacterized conserved coiled coil protein [Desulfuromonas acetoxidans DSM 684]MBF0645155.1 coiled coil domain-containing protein [Desulfuromonas acetoxidans]NVD24041.1 coiled coil domain-containing protein [Desulfuromonas acetoxidans]NVE16337.1 coiled coil domain-containing protein [Desulfuromonas acetoxidans]
MDKKHAYEEKLQAQLDEFNARIDLLKAKAAKAESSTKISYADTLEALRMKRNLAEDKLDELKAASDDAWEDLKEGIDKAWSDFNAALKSATSHFQ